MEVDKHKIWLGIGVSVVVIGVLVLLMYNSGGVKAGKAIASVVPLTLGVGEIGIDPASATLNTGDEFGVTVKANLGENKKATKVNFWVFYDYDQLEMVKGDILLTTEKNWPPGNFKPAMGMGNVSFDHSLDPQSPDNLKLTGTVDLFKIKFKVKSSASGSTIISLSDPKVLEDQTNLITAEPKSAVFTLLGACVPQCFGKACGDDGCGGSCGACEAGECQNGACVKTDIGGFWSEANAIDLTDGKMKETSFSSSSIVHPLYLGGKTFGLKMAAEDKLEYSGDYDNFEPYYTTEKNIFIYDQSNLLYSYVVSGGWHLLMDVGGEKLYVDMGNDESKLSLRWVKPDVVEDCTNGIDEDLDDEIDCADSECKGEINSEGKVCTHSVTMAGMTYTGWCSSNSCVSSDKSCYDDGALALVGSKNLVCNNHNWVTCVQSTLGPSPSGKFNCVKEGTKFVWKAADGEAACISNCAGKTCGDDGCGGSCGACVTPATEIPATELNCGDGTDNDDDTLIDCSDINDCAEGTSCGMGKACSNAFCTFKVEEGNYDAKEVVNEGDVAAIKLNPAGFWNYVGNNVQKLNQYLKKMSDNWKK